MAVLGPQTERHYSVGRRHTRLTVVGERTETQSFDLAGNLEPEAFSTDHTNLFVLQYRPALAPNSYQVRRLDLATGKLHDIYTPDKHLQESMRGDARVQAISPDGSRLYTLYSLRTAHGSHSFIHVLNLDEKWAHCIDLPADFGIGAGSTALSVSADGNRLFVANGAAHAVAEVDTQALQVVRSAAVDFGVPRDAFAAQSNDTLYVGSGSTLTSIDLAGLTKGSTWAMDQRITGIQIEEDPGYIYVGLRNRIAVIDPVTGKRIKSLDPPGVGMIGLLGRATRTINAVPEHFTCAC
jgi:DNA-binding beta-propeller fold protein YncE